MPNRTIAVHTTESNIKQLDEMAKEIRRSRNSLMNEGIEMVLEYYHAIKPKPAKKKKQKEEEETA
jgi:predicted transcriptional regulator